MTKNLDLHKFAPAVKRDRELQYKLTGLAGAVARFDLAGGGVDVVIADGMVSDVRAAAGEADVIYAAPQGFWDVVDGSNPPAPGYEGMTGGSMKGLTVNGDLKALIAPYNPAWERLFQIYAETQRGPIKRTGSVTEPYKATDNAIGRYIYITVDGVESRVYYETAGTGPVPMILQHTAGADGRQWRHLLADPDLQRDFTMVAYDLPYHGRSLPPSRVSWWEEPYTISQKKLMDTVVAISDAVGLDKPIFMGCSVGGQLALDLAAFHADKFRAFISLNGWHDMAPLGEHFSNDPYRDPSISQSLYATGCLSVTSPLAPEANRQETYWIYRSGFPGIYAGDNDYFSFGHDLRKDGHLIDAKKHKVYVLTGSYDPSIFFDASGGEAVARNVPGVIYKVMPGMSHFAPSDDPVPFRNFLIPILAEITAG